MKEEIIVNPTWLDCANWGFQHTSSEDKGPRWYVLGKKKNNPFPLQSYWVGNGFSFPNEESDFEYIIKPSFPDMVPAIHLLISQRNETLIRQERLVASSKSILAVLESTL